MGEVYRDSDSEAGASVAIKVLHGTTPAERARFEFEAEMLADIRHPAIVRYIAHGFGKRSRVSILTRFMRVVGCRMFESPQSSMMRV